MNILLVSECTKQAASLTCSLLDQFAERKGSRCWQTHITQEGLKALHRLLRQRARRNTAVACHWIKKGGGSELLWIVGNQRRFNSEGNVPTHTTRRDILKLNDENNWHSLNAISLAVGIAGLFHDFGKANALFQHSLDPTIKSKAGQPYRHEWVSLRLFCAFVNQHSDPEWIQALCHIQAEDEPAILQRLYRDSPNRSNSPFESLPEAAQFIGWLILSHHRLPLPLLPEDKHRWPSGKASHWLTQQLNSSWNAINDQHRDWSQQQREDNWLFPAGTPLRSQHWRRKAQSLAGKIVRDRDHFLQYIKLSALNTEVADGEPVQNLNLVLARMTLVLADHSYSAGAANPHWQDADYPVWANTEFNRKKYKQRLDEHNIGVAHYAYLLTRQLPHLRQSLPAITRHKGFKRRSAHADFRWQDKAWELARALQQQSQQQGFFGINMASTGCGKTFANARIMYGLANEQQGARFSIALGLRTLTLQTGDALASRLQLDSDSLAVLIGSQAVKTLHHGKASIHDEKMAETGSASAEDLLDDNSYVYYDGELEQGRLGQYLQQQPEARRLLSAPILVSTIDHLIGSTERIRGGKHIAPILRLLTSDLILDEPDDFDIADQHALCRLVNMAGMLGCRVLLSSATLLPELVACLFVAYRKGRQAWHQVCGTPGYNQVCCAWFDENGCEAQTVSLPKAFKSAHQQFILKRLAFLNQQPVLRRARVLTLPDINPSSGIPEQLALTLRPAMLGLHQQHHQCQGSQRLSVGLIRFANITPMVAVAQALLQQKSPPGLCIHYCVYHSQHPLALRSAIEQQLDQVLTRKDEQQIWQLPLIKQKMQDYPAQDHLFVILATAVAEVGRDWDLDWAIAEPSSMRSLIQLAGRVRRHRQRPIELDQPNMVILDKNIRALQKKAIAYCRPGFENQDFPLTSHCVSQLMQDVFKDQPTYAIDAQPRIHVVQLKLDSQGFGSLAALEHYRTLSELWQGTSSTSSGSLNYLVGQQHLPNNGFSWNALLQKKYPFRARTQEEQRVILWIEDEHEKPQFRDGSDPQSVLQAAAGFEPYPIALAEGVSGWPCTDYLPVYQALAQRFNLSLQQVSQQFGEIILARLSAEQVQKSWHYHPLLGVFKDFNHNEAD